MNAQTNAIKFDNVMDALAHVERRRFLLALLDRNPKVDASPTIEGDRTDSPEH